MFRFELKAIQVSQITAVTPKKTILVVHFPLLTLEGGAKMEKHVLIFPNNFE